MEPVSGFTLRMTYLSGVVPFFRMSLLTDDAFFPGPGQGRMLLQVLFHHRDIDGFGRRDHLAALEHFVRIPAARQIFDGDDPVAGLEVKGSGPALFIQDLRPDDAGTRRTRAVNDLAQTCGMQQTRPPGSSFGNAVLKSCP